ncbi:MAG: adenylate/guanylate cyclase domain-containing protein [Spirochaetia bacterium]
MPEFKAGAHWGTVIIGEIGLEKKEITYLGDVINTTARIEGLCTSTKRAFVISESLFSLIDLPIGYRADRLGKATLRGKEEKILVYGVEKNEK